MDRKGASGAGRKVSARQCPAPADRSCPKGRGASLLISQPQEIRSAGAADMRHGAEAGVGDPERRDSPEPIDRPGRSRWAIRLLAPEAGGQLARPSPPSGDQGSELPVRRPFPFCPRKRSTPRARDGLIAVQPLVPGYP